MSDFPTTPLPSSTPDPKNTKQQQAAAPDTKPVDATPTTPLNTDAQNDTSTQAQPTQAPSTPAQSTQEQPTVPLNPDGWAPGSHAVPVAPGAASAPRRNRPRFSTILWGVLLLVFAGFMVAWTVLPTAPDPTLLLLGAVIAIGVALVAAGIAAASRRAG
jgi:hypothetical protein